MVLKVTRISFGYLGEWEGGCEKIWYGCKIWVRYIPTKGKLTKGYNFTIYFIIEDTNMDDLNIEYFNEHLRASKLFMRLCMPLAIYVNHISWNYSISEHSNFLEVVYCGPLMWSGVWDMVLCRPLCIYVKSIMAKKFQKKVQWIFRWRILFFLKIFSSLRRSIRFCVSIKVFKLC